MALDFPASPVDGQVYDNYVWVDALDAWRRLPIDPAIPLGNLDDVTLTSPTTGQILEFNGTDWVNGQVDAAGIASDAVTTAKILDANVTTAKLGTGAVLQVVQTVKTSTYGVSLAQGAQDTNDVTGLTVSITPRATSSKILVIVQAVLAQQTSASLFRDGSNLNYIGDSALTRGRVSIGGAENQRTSVSANLTYLDSPNTTSSVTYSIRLTSSNTGTAAVYLNRTNDDTNDNRYMRSASSITVMEIAG